jgi:photosystem II stability/assembly factor-like uncharacterized protein
VKARTRHSIASISDGTKLVAAVQNGLIYTSTDSGFNWIERATNENWYGVASNSDGTKLVAVVPGGLICTSTDSGVTWIPRTSTDAIWYGVTSNSDGTKVVAVGNNIYCHLNVLP